jgi:hypothetical protein
MEGLCLRPFSVFRQRRALFTAVAWSLMDKQADWHIAMDASLEHASGLRVYPNGLITCEQVTIRPYLFQKMRLKRLYRATVYERSLKWFTSTGVEGDFRRVCVPKEEK